jgi:hypothetical protein
MLCILIIVRSTQMLLHPMSKIKSTLMRVARPPLRSSGQSSWLQIQRSRVRFLALPDFFWEVVGLERGPLSLVMIIAALFQGNSGSGLENRKFTTVGEPLRWPRDTLYPLKLALTSPTSGGRSVGRYSSLADSSHGVFMGASIKHDQKIFHHHTYSRRLSGFELNKTSRFMAQSHWTCIFSLQVHSWERSTIVETLISMLFQLVCNSNTHLNWTE